MEVEASRSEVGGHQLHSKFKASLWYMRGVEFREEKKGEEKRRKRESVRQVERGEKMLLLEYEVICIPVF